MAKKLAKLNPKKSDVHPQNETEGMEVSQVAFEPIGDDELNALIEKGQELYEKKHGKGTSWIPRFIITDELAAALLTRNAANRYPDPKIQTKYANLMITPKMGEDGNPIVSTPDSPAMKWDFAMPTIITMSDIGNLHNSQKCLRALLQAKDMLRENANEVKMKKQGVTDLEAETGITEDMLEMVGILKEIPEEAADYEDTAQQRTNADLGYRRRLFAKYDFSFLKSKGKEGENPDAKHKAEVAWKERLPKVYQKLAKDHNSVLNFVFRRINDKGCLPRQRPSYGSEFSKDAFIAANKEFPGATDSVFHMFELLQAKDKKAAFVKLKVSLPYMTTAHYLASMHNATYDKKAKVWKRAEDGLQWADAFVDNLLIGSDDKVIKAWREKVSAMESKGDKELNSVFISLCYLWRHFAFEEEIPAMQLILGGTTENPFYSKTGSSDEFDHKHITAKPQVEVDEGTKPEAVKGKGLRLQRKAS